MNYCKLIPNVVADPDKVSLLDQINTNSGIWYATIDLVNCFFPHTNLEGPPKAIFFFLAGLTVYLHGLALGLSQFFCLRNLNLPNIPQTVTLLCYIEGVIMLIVSEAQKAASTLDELVKHMRTTG